MNSLLSFEFTNIKPFEIDCPAPSIWDFVVFSRPFEFARSTPGWFLVIGLVGLLWLIFAYLIPVWNIRKKSKIVKEKVKVLVVIVILYVLLLLKLYYEFSHIEYCL